MGRISAPSHTWECMHGGWTHRRLKGAIEFEKPSGEVFLRGSKVNQLYLLDLVKEFTEEYVGKLPKMCAATNRRSKVTLHPWRSH